QGSSEFIHELFRGSDRETKTDPTTAFARSFLRLANMPNFALDRLSRYEATLWRQAGRIIYALETLDRRKTARTNPAPFLLKRRWWPRRWRALRLPTHRQVV